MKEDNLEYAYWKMEQDVMNGNTIKEVVNLTRKKIIFVFIIFLFIISILNFVSSLANPSSVYCNELGKQYGGYEYKIKTDGSGNQKGYCVVNKEELDSWAFLEGKVGKKYAKINPQEFDLEFDSKSKLTSVDYGKNKVVSSSKAKSAMFFAGYSLSSGYSQSNYSYWDWRSPPNTTSYSSSNYAYFDASNGWVTSIKDQASCGSCWSHAIMGAIEAKYEINQNNSRLNLDLAEQNSISCDHSCYSGYYWPADAANGCQAGCSGGYLDLAFKYTRDTGVVDEACFPFTGTDSDCASICSDSSSRKWTISQYNTTWPEIGAMVILTANETKQWLMDFGPLSTAIYMETSSDPGSSIYRCSNDAHSPNHAVLLVGYNDTGNLSTSYWIIKNSWGVSWGINGYFKLGFNECNFSSEFDFPYNINPINIKPSIILNSPSQGYTTSNSSLSFNFTSSNKLSQNLTCDLIINNITRNSTNALNSTPTIMSYNLSLGYYNWSITCWEKNIGVINISTRTLQIVSNSPICINIANQTWVMNSNLTINLSNYCSNPDNLELNYSSHSVDNITILINQTTKIVTLIPNVSFNGTRYVVFLANNSLNSNATNNITLNIFKPVITINTSIFSLSTNFSNLTNFINISIILGNNQGNISFDSASLNNQTIDLDSYVNISFNHIEINSTSLPGLNKSATLTLLNLSWTSPMILKDGTNCSSCTILNYTNSTLRFNVTSFSSYTTRENPVCGDSSCESDYETCSSCSSDCGSCSSPGGGSSSGGGGGGPSTYTITENQLSRGYNQVLARFDKIKFNISKEYTLNLKSLTNTNASLSLDSKLFNANLSLELNETKFLFLNNENNIQLRIRLNSIKNSKANITLTRISSSSDEGSNDSGEGNSSKNPLGSDNLGDNETNIFSFNSNSVLYDYILFGIIALIVIILITIYFYLRDHTLHIGKFGINNSRKKYKKSK